MKKGNSILKMVTIFAALILVSCNQSVKGKWSEADKQKFHNDMNGIKELSSLGEKKEAWIECYLSKAEANFSSYYEADNDEAGCEKIALECRSEIFSNGSVKGKWSKIDKEKFRSDIAEIESLSNFGESRTAWIECYLSKLEMNYSSYFEADSDVDGCGRLAEECTAEVLGE